jgi:hypothetical protein
MAQSAMTGSTLMPYNLVGCGKAFVSKPKTCTQHGCQRQRFVKEK